MAVIAALRPFRRQVDRWAVVYVLASGFYPLLNPSVLPSVWPHLAFHLALAAVLWVLPAWLRGRRRAGWRLLGEILVPLLFPLFYAELEFLGRVFFGLRESFDPWLIDIEHALFGGQPSLEWSRVLPFPWLRELMEFAYFSYYFFAFIAVGLIWRQRAWDRERRWALTAGFVRDLVAVMLTCYTWYTFFPVWGPKYFAEIGVAGPVTIQGWVFTWLMKHIHEGGALQGAAFPSSHVAGSMVAWWWVWKLLPRHRWWMTTLWLSLCASIVYCRYHYLIDLLAGVLWGALIMALCARFAERPARVARRS